MYFIHCQTHKLLRDLFSAVHRSYLCKRHVQLYKNYLARKKDAASIYIHWPYCKKRCSYCNFNKYIKQVVDHDRMKQCLVQELKYSLQLSQVNSINSVFFGGGTPSLAEASTIETILNTVKQQVEVAGDMEVTLEVNPTQMESAKLKEFKDAGINRVSIGIQSLNAIDLKLFGRNHSVEEGLRCLEISKRIFPAKTSCDVIFGRPKQTLSNWRKELQLLTSVACSHISLYQLTVERGTALYNMIKDKQVVMPNDDSMADLYEAAVEILEKAGFIRYEVSNFAQNEEAECVHNKAYWSANQYIGIGPGAHSRFVPSLLGNKNRQARIQTLVPERWIEEVENFGHGTKSIKDQSRFEILEELLMMGLRTKTGILQEDWLQFSENSLLEAFDKSAVVEFLEKENFIQMNARRMRATHQGLNVIDSFLPDLLNVLHERVYPAIEKTCKE